MARNRVEKVVIVGSGVSRSLAGVPIQNEFWQQIDEYINRNGMGLYHARLRDQLNQAAKLDRLGETYNSADMGDIEKRFSWLHSFTYSSRTPEIKKIALTLTRYYRAIIAKYLCSIRAEKQLINIDKERIRNENENAVVISMNFDEFYEEMCLDEGTFFYPGFDTEGLLRKVIGNNKTEILKIHGSVSWMEERKVKEYSLSFQSRGNTKNHWKKVKYVRRRDELGLHPYDASMIRHPSKLTLAYTPVIIPFFRQKKEWYTQLWRRIFVPIYKRCAEVLSECKEIIIFGYGLPEADWTITELLTACGRDLEAVRVVLPPRECECNHESCNCRISEVKPPEEIEKYKAIFGAGKVRYEPRCFRTYFDN